MAMTPKTLGSNAMQLFPASQLLSFTLLALLSTLPSTPEAARVPRSLSQASTCSTSSFCTTRAAGLYANPCDTTCTTFIQCSNTQTFVTPCGPSTVFNPTQSYCDWPANYVCPGGSTSSPTPSPTPSPSPVRSPSPTPSPTPTPSPIPTPSPTPSPNSACSASTFCATHADGLYANPCDGTCNGFIQCSYSNTYLKTCSPNLVFNPTHQFCDWSYNYACPSNGAGPVPSPTPTPSPTPSPTPTPTPAGPSPSPVPTPSPTPGSTGIMFSQYKDVGTSLNWNTYIMSTSITGTLLPVTQVMPGNNRVLTLAFATGACAHENWAGIQPSDFAKNVAALVAAGKQYIISTGGAAGSFTCASDADFTTFINTYNSANLIGVDFDIEAGQSQADIDNLVARVVAAKKVYPNMRWSFTLATLGGSPSNGDMMGSAGKAVLASIKKQGLGWTNVFINLMAMDYGAPGPYVCSVGSDGKCDMAQSAINAAESVHQFYAVPYPNIEITPMIGGNDVQDEIFTIADAQTVSAYVVAKNLGGVHVWSLDRDKDCSPGYASSTCNSYGQGGVLGFTKTFLTALGW